MGKKEGKCGEEVLSTGQGGDCRRLRRGERVLLQRSKEGAQRVG